jgi:predicted phosphodiesterase
LRVAVISDIHGNLLALDAVTTDIDLQGVDEVWCGGDIAWGGPWAHECIDRIRSADYKTVKGNTDVWVTGDPQTLTSEQERRELREIAGAHSLTPEESTWLLNLPLGHSAPGSILLVHGTPDSPFIGPMPDAPAAEFEPYEGRAALVVYGHVHRAFVRRLTDGTLVCNTGAVGLPMDGDTACYLIVDHDGAGFTLRHRRVSYDRRGVIAEAKRRNDAASRWFLEKFE